MRVARSFFSDAAFIFDFHSRRWGRFFVVLTAASLAALPAPAAEAWDLLVEVDAAGGVSVVSQSPVEGAVPPPQPLREGLTCLELHDDGGRLLDRRALSLAPEHFFDAESAGGGLEGGVVAAPRMAYHVRLPRPAPRRQVLRFSRLRRRPDASAPRRAAAPSARSPAALDEFFLDPRGEAVLVSP